MTAAAGDRTMEPVISAIRHTDVVRHGRALGVGIVFVAVLLGSGCDDTSAQQSGEDQMRRARLTWSRERPDEYELRTHLEQGFGSPPSGDYVIHVRGRKVTAVESADGSSLELGPQWTDFSVDGTFAVLASVLRSSKETGDKVTVTYDEQLGYPRRIDVESDATDGGWSARHELSRAGENVALLTQANGANGESALGTGVLRFDSVRNCVYLDHDGRRTLPQWPEGYSAVASPLRVYDQTGTLVAEEGKRLTSGGGYHDPTELGTGVNRCGVSRVDGLFVMGHPQDDPR